MIHLETELDGKPVEIRNIKNADHREELNTVRLRLFDSILTTPCPVCKSASRATIVLMSDEGEIHTRFHSYCHQEFVDSLENILPQYLPQR